MIRHALTTSGSDDLDRGSGLREAHCHLHSHGQSQAMIALDGCRTLDECLDVLEKTARERGMGAAGGAWMLARGARPESWPEHR